MSSADPPATPAKLRDRPSSPPTDERKPPQRAKHDNAQQAGFASALPSLDEAHDGAAAKQSAVRTGKSLQEAIEVDADSDEVDA